MGVYYPDASNPQLFTGWKAATELGPAILATAIAATAFSLWLFILFFRSSESRRIQRETDRYQQALRRQKRRIPPDKIPLFRITTWRQRPCEATTVVLRMYCGSVCAKESLLLQAVQNARKEARKELEEQREALNQRESILQKKELALETTLEKARKYVAGERHNTVLARLEAEKAEERRRNACATAERRRRKLEKLQATGGTAGQKH
jgi:hypothetical protein